MIGAAVALVLLPTQGAAGAWGVTASGTSRGASEVLAPPTALKGAWSPGVRLTWTPSASAWATRQRVLRAVTPTGARTVLAELDRSVASYDDPVGAGSYYYWVQAFLDGSWTSSLAEATPHRVDRTYVLNPSAPASTTGCAPAGVARGMQQGLPLVSTSTTATLGSTVYTFCTDTWSSGQALPAGSTTVTAHVANTANKACSVVVGVSVAGTSLGSATVSIEAGRTATTAAVWSLDTTARTFTTGQRLSVTLTPQSGGGCNSTTLHAGSTAHPSRVTLTG